jgi:hypothetical protein
VLSTTIVRGFAFATASMSWSWSPGSFRVCRSLPSEEKLLAKTTATLAEAAALAAACHWRFSCGAQVRSSMTAEAEGASSRGR